jgi:hypothetical protein
MKLVQFVLPFARSCRLWWSSHRGVVIRTSGSAALGLMCLFSACRARSAGSVSPPAGLVSWWQAEGNANDTLGTNNGALLAWILHKPVEEMGGRGVRKLENTELYDDTLYHPESHRL